MGLFSSSKSSSTTSNYTDASGIQAGGAAFRSDGAMTVTTADPAVMAAALASVENILTKQIDAQKEWTAKSIAATREAQSIALGDVAIARNIASEDAAKARQADGGRSEKIITYALLAVAGSAIAFAFLGAK